MLYQGFAQRQWLTMAGVTVSVLSLMAAAGCGTNTSRAIGPRSGRPVVIVVRNGADGKSIAASVGDRLELILSSSYWHVIGSSAPGVLRQDGPPVLLSRPRTCPGIPGRGCIPVRTDFIARTTGQAAITATRSTCGEARLCRPGQRRFTVTVVVAVRN